MTPLLRYGLADGFLTEETVSSPKSLTAATSRTLLSDEPSHTFEAAHGERMITVDLARSGPWWLYGRLQVAQRLSALAGTWRLCRVWSSIDSATIGGSPAVGGVFGGSIIRADAEATAVEPLGDQNPAETTFIVYGVMDAPLAPSVPANVCTYGSGFLSAAAPAIDPAARLAAFGMAEPRDPVSSFVEPLRMLTELLEQRRPFEAPVEVRVLADLALRRLEERQQDDIDRWARRLIDGLPDADD